MTRAKRRFQILMIVAVSMIVLAAPARGGDWFGLQVGPGGFSLSFGSTDWAVFGSAWHDPGWRVDYHVALSGYGEWVWVDGLGQCWRPWVATGWRPYTHGRWVWTHLGWTWVAYEPWGYFPHHYGNWALSPHGWVWSPGYVYRPANVVWVGAGAYVGWYASPPPGWSHARRGWHRGYNRGYNRGYDHGWNDGYATGWNDAQHATYTRWQHFGADDLSRHAVAHNSVTAGRAVASVRPGISAPDRSDLGRRGIRTPQLGVESRVVRVGDRQVTVTRPAGVEAAVRRHAKPTIQRALNRDAQSTAVTRSRSERAAPTAGSRPPAASTRISTRRSPRAATSAAAGPRQPDRSRQGRAPAPVAGRTAPTAAPDSGHRGSRSSSPEFRSTPTRGRSATASAPNAANRRPAPSASSRTRSTHQRSVPADIRSGIASSRQSREAVTSGQHDRRISPSSAARSPRDARSSTVTRSGAAGRQVASSRTDRSRREARSTARTGSRQATADRKRGSSASTRSSREVQSRERRRSNDDARRSHRRGDE